jgi:hypothetical protein
MSWRNFSVMAILKASCPVTFEKYTGQESDEQKKKSLKIPGYITYQLCHDGINLDKG